jgi:peptidoglycan hydrolase-like protein with peptidoglycan-binding domain
VKDLQTMLNGAGANLTVDGSFGAKTAGAVRNFQSSHGLPSTGVADAKTVQALEKGVARAVPVEPKQETKAPVSPAAQRGTRQAHGQAGTEVRRRAEGMLPEPSREVRTADVRAGRAVAAEGSSGSAVKDMQKRLNKTELKPDLPVTGQFSAQDRQALQRYQESRGLQGTGQLDKDTANALQSKMRPASEPAPEPKRWSLFGSRGTEKAGAVSSMSSAAEARKYDEYRATIERNGGKFREGPEQRNILAFRTPTNAHANGATGAYDDKTVMLWKDAQGNKRVREYQSNTDPTSQYAGKNGYAQNPGRLQEGYHEFRSRLYHPDSSDSIKQALEPVRAVKYQRLSAADGKSVVGGGSNSSFLFHGGAADNTLSAGCQTMPPNEWSRFWRDVHAAGDPGVMGYTLVRK